MVAASPLPGEPAVHELFHKRRQPCAIVEVARALRTAQPTVAKPVLHLVCIVTGKTDFQFHVLRLTQSVCGSECAENEPTMQRRRAFFAERWNETRLHLPGNGKAGEQNQSATGIGHALIVAGMIQEETTNEQSAAWRGKVASQGTRLAAARPDAKRFSFRVRLLNFVHA